MAKWKEWAMIGLVTLTGAVSLGSDCDVRVTGDDGFRIDVDNDDDDFWDDLEDLFD